MSPSEYPNIHRFAHEAMATIFEVILVEEDATYARQAAREAFVELDRLEDELSRFRESSDIARLHYLQPGETLRLGVATFECLCLARRVHAATGGAFDPTVGPLVDWWRRAAGTAHGEAVGGTDPNTAGFEKLDATAEVELSALRERVGMGLLELDEKELSVRVARAGISVDLGAIGKGYAVDVMAGLLREWSIGAALIHGGQSSVYALGTPPGEAANELAAERSAAAGWRVAVRRPGEPDAPALAAIRLRDQALSGSGTAFHGGHIIDPRTGRPAACWGGTWAIAPTAAESDALSTAFMLMSREEIKACRTRYLDSLGAPDPASEPAFAALVATNEASPALIPFGPDFLECQGI